MNMYKKIMVSFVVLILTFYGGYRVGLVYGTRWATEILVDMGRFYVASRSAAGIAELHNMKSSVIENKSILCLMRDSVMRQAEDMVSCRQSQGCAKNFDGPIYTESEKYVLEFEKIACLQE